MEYQFWSGCPPYSRTWVLHGIPILEWVSALFRLIRVRLIRGLDPDEKKVKALYNTLKTQDQLPGWFNTAITKLDDA